MNPPVIIITRPYHQAQGFKALLEQAGFMVLLMPSISICTSRPDRSHRQVLTDLSTEHYDWLVFTSSNGVRATAEIMKLLAMHTKLPPQLNIAVVGRKTAQALQHSFQCEAQLMPTVFTADALGAALQQMGVVRKKILLISPINANPSLAHRLQDIGAKVDSLPVYRTVDQTHALDRAQIDLISGRTRVLTFFSPSSFRSALRHQRALLSSAFDDILIAGIGPVTSAAIRAAGWQVHIEAAEQTEESLAQAIIDYLGGTGAADSVADFKIKMEDIC